MLKMQSTAAIGVASSVIKEVILSNAQVPKGKQVALKQRIVRWLVGGMRDWPKDGRRHRGRELVNAPVRSEDVIERVELLRTRMRDQMLISRVMQREVGNIPVTEEELRQRYAREQAQFAVPGQSLRGSSVHLGVEQALRVEALVQGDITGAELVLRTTLEQAPLRQVVLISVVVPFTSIMRGDAVFVARFHPVIAVR